MNYRFSSLLFSMLCLTLGSLSSVSTAFAKQEVKTSIMHGIVKNIIDVPSYTYVEVKSDDKLVWVAAPTTKIKTGSKISFSTVMPMQNFRSESIDKTFPLIFFVSNIEIDKNAVVSSMETSDQAKIKITDPARQGLDKISGGKNIVEIYAEKDSLKGRVVKIRGQVTRFSAEILGKNWVHIKDNSARDLTITTNETAELGDIVIIEGIVAVDKDFGHGYFYPVMIEQAKFISE